MVFLLTALRTTVFLFVAQHPCRYNMCHPVAPCDRYTDSSLIAGYSKRYITINEHLEFDVAN